MDAGLAERTMQVVGQCVCECPLAAQHGFWQSPASGALVLAGVLLLVALLVVLPDALS